MSTEQPPYPYEPPPEEKSGAGVPAVPSWVWLAVVLGAFLVVIAYGLFRAMDTNHDDVEQTASHGNQDASSRTRSTTPALPTLGGGESVFSGNDPLGDIVEGREVPLPAAAQALTAAGLAVSEGETGQESDPKKSVSLIDDRPITVDGGLQLSDP